MTNHRLSRFVVGTALCAMLLVGCSTGNANEAERAQRADAQETSVISDMQATHTWNLINGTPESTPETTPAP